MESEKVKEIKKALECCAKGLCGSTCPRFDKGHINIYCQNELNIDILTLINEFENENTRLLDSVETVQNNRCVYKCELTKNTLKQFAERLKEKATVLTSLKFDHRSLSFPEIQILDFDDIDETLNEFLKGENNE